MCVNFHGGNDGKHEPYETIKFGGAMRSIPIDMGVSQSCCAHLNHLFPNDSLPVTWIMVCRDGWCIEDVPFVVIAMLG